MPRSDLGITMPRRDPHTRNVGVTVGSARDSRSSEADPAGHTIQWRQSWWQFLPPRLPPKTTRALRRLSKGPGRTGGAEGTRTPDPHTASVVRYQLRHSPVVLRAHY